MRHVNKPKPTLVRGLVQSKLILSKKSKSGTYFSSMFYQVYTVRGYCMFLQICSSHWTAFW